MYSFGQALAMRRKTCAKKDLTENESIIPQSKGFGEQGKKSAPIFSVIDEVRTKKRQHTDFAASIGVIA